MIYDDILKFYFAQNYLDAAAPLVRQQFTGATFGQKILHFLMPFGKFFKRETQYCRRYQAFFTPQNLEGKIWLFVGSLNNRESLKFLLDNLPDTVFVGNGSPFDPADRYQIPFHRTVLHAHRFPKIWLFFKKKYGNRAVRYADFLFRCTGLYEVAFEALRRCRPRCIVLANDHSEKQRALLAAAKRLGVPTVYLQHASISQFMPPLDFDLSLLEGQDAWDKYRTKGRIGGEVRLVGMPKFDRYAAFRNPSTTVRRVGVCTNLLEEVGDISTFLKALQAAFPTLQLTFRPHPADKRTFDTPSTVRRSDRTESVFEFLQQQDLIVAGSSSVHLEATLLNVTSVYFEISPLQENMKDAYGYVKNELIQSADNQAVLFEIVQKQLEFRPSVFQKARYFNAVVGTPDEGKSGELAAQFIQDFLHGRGRESTAIEN